MPPAMKLDFASHLYFKFLSVVPLFTGLPTALLHSLCTIMEPMLAVHGQVIYTQGSSGTEMYMLLSGELEITHINGLGQSERLGFLSDGAFFGALLRVAHYTTHSGLLDPSVLLRNVTLKCRLLLQARHRSWITHPLLRSGGAL
jgi:hypothetical protein